MEAIADSLYEELQAASIEIIYDDRNVNAGVMFSDADLLGIPIRIIISPRNMKDSCCEIQTRGKNTTRKVKINEVLLSTQELIKKLQV